MERRGAREPIEQDEALPQLCYIAYAMMQGGMQKIGRPDLTRLLREARAQLSAELAYARIGIPEFIERIEHRSSLLMMSGHDVVDGTLTEFYEFRHLTFQEYLTAKALVEGWYPNRKESDTLVSLLEPHFEDEKWREVIPLAAVLAGRKADALVRALTKRCAALSRERFGPLESTPVSLALGNCLADEAQVTPETLRQVLQALIFQGVALGGAPFMPHLARGKYGMVLREEAGQAFLAGDPNLRGTGSALAGSFFHQMVSDQSAESLEAALPHLRGLLTDADILRRCEGALGTMFVAFRLHWASHTGEPTDRTVPITCRELLRTCADALVPLLFSENPPEQFAACWALVWIGACQVWTPSIIPNVLERLFTLWLRGSKEELCENAAWAFASLPLLPREAEPLQASSAIKEFSVAADKYEEMDDPSYKVKSAVLVAAYYLRFPWNDAELARLVKEIYDMAYAEKQTLRDIMVALNVEGVDAVPEH